VTATQKYLAYLPHSGFHNERVELQNALMLAHLLDRALVVPRVRIGRAMAWAIKPNLQSAFERSQKQPSQVEACRPLLPELEALGRKDRWTGDLQCEHYAQYVGAWSRSVGSAPHFWAQRAHGLF
jgi:hypothetical protein